MYKQYRVSGRYFAKHPDGRYSTDLGVGATVFAKDEQDAKHIVAKNTMGTHGYINFKWVSVSVKKNSVR